MSQTQHTAKTVANRAQTTADGRPITTERIEDAGVLAFAADGVGAEELIGFADVDDWDAIRSALIKRGLGVGAIHHLETFEPAEVGL